MAQGGALCQKIPSLFIATNSGPSLAPKMKKAIGLSPTAFEAVPVASR
jgi:hypothetical protein